MEYNFLDNIINCIFGGLRCQITGVWNALVNSNRKAPGLVPEARKYL